VRLALSAVLAVALGACVGPPPTHVLIVRHPESKCALIAFSGCAAFVTEDELLDEDAGVVTPPE